MSGTNYIKKVAIVGVNGSVGKHIVCALQRAGRHEITALTRGSGAGAPPGVRIASVSYDDKESLVAALRGQDALVITLSTRAAQGTQDKLLEAAAAAGVSFILPNEWGIEAAQGGLGDDALLGPAARDARRRVEDLGRSAWIAVTTGFWFAHSLATADAYGFDLARRSVTFFDDGTAKINTITWEKTGEAVAKLLSLPIEAEAAGRPALSEYKNRTVYVSSWRMSQKDMFRQVLRVSGTQESDWAVRYEPAAARYEAARELLFSGDRSAFVRVLYTRTFYDNGDGDFESRYGLDNDKLGLAEETQESLDAETRLAYELVESGYKY